MYFEVTTNSILIIKTVFKNSNGYLLLIEVGLLYTVNDLNLKTEQLFTCSHSCYE